MRISDWSSDVCSSDLFPPLACQRPQSLGMQGQRHARAPSRRIVAEFEFAIMLLDDLLDDREPQSRAALPRRHIRLGNRLASLWEPDSVVADPDDDRVPLGYREFGMDMADRRR